MCHLLNLSRLSTTFSTSRWLILEAILEKNEDIVKQSNECNLTFLIDFCLQLFLPSFTHSFPPFKFWRAFWFSFPVTTAPNNPCKFLFLTGITTDHLFSTDLITQTCWHARPFWCSVTKKITKHFMKCLGLSYKTKTVNYLLSLSNLKSTQHPFILIACLRVKWSI